MRIAYLAAGAAGMYCGSCLHDNTLAAAMQRLGEDAVLVPTYTPLRTDEPSVAGPRVFVGGVSAYLRQAIPAWRRAPRWVDRLLDQPWLLRLATRGGGSVDPAQLGGLTVSMLRGAGGAQASQLPPLVEWLARDFRPEVVHLSNTMLLGMAAPIAEATGAAVVVSLSGEDGFLDRLAEPHRGEALRLVREHAARVDALVAMNAAYADRMAGYLNIDRERIAVVPHGVNAERFPPRDHTQPPNGTLRVGHLARVTPGKGLDVLVEACESLARTRPDLRFDLDAAGYLGPADREYLARVTDRADRGPLAGRFRYHGELDFDGKVEFLRSLDLFATPTASPEAKGLPAIEAMAAGAPCVLPEHGGFPELIAAAGGGVTHAPGDAADLAAQMERLLDDAPLRRRLGEAAAAGVRNAGYTAERMAERTRDLYRRVVERRRPVSGG
ncbi:MAG: glycosyltransferase family 4 protein [Planctomycetota bacterium]